MSAARVNVLLVEDNEVDREVVRRAFAKSGISHPIHVANDGVEALEMLRGAEGKLPLPRPFLILLDINMPRMNGIELLRQLRQDPELHDSVVFVLTTSKREQDRVASYAYNVAGYMVKGEVGQGFSKAVEMLDRYWRVVELP